jgi:hypothetical protein
MRKIIILLLLLIPAVYLAAQAQFDINAFSDSTKYGWEDWRDRASYREALLDRQDLLQLYEMEVNPIRTSILKSALVPGWGQISSKAGTKGSILLAAELLSVGVSLYFYDRSNYYYDKYLQATQIEQIEEYYSAAQNPRYYSMLFIGLGAIVWGYNIFDVIQTTDNYNAQLWQEILEKYGKKTVSLGPQGIRVNF